MTMSQTPVPTIDEELMLQAQGYVAIAGVDEAGRGSIFGPVCVGMVVLPLHDTADLLEKLSDVRDSKKLSRPKVYRLADVIKEVAVGWGVGEGTATEVDQVGIVVAIRLAAERALNQLQNNYDIQVDYLLTDSRLPCPTAFPPAQQRGMVKGDLHCLSIASAAIVAKTYHDQLVRALAENYSPDYQLANNVGYGTQAHRDAIARLGRTPHHRHSFNIKSLAND